MGADTGATGMTPASPLDRTDVDVVVVGGGFSVLYLLHRLRTRGFSARADSMPAGPRCVDEGRSEPLDLAVKGHLVDLDASLCEGFLEVAIGESRAQPPLHGAKDHLRWQSEPSEPSGGLMDDQWRRTAPLHPGNHIRLGRGTNSTPARTCQAIATVPSNWIWAIEASVSRVLARDMLGVFRWPDLSVDRKNHSTRVDATADRPRWRPPGYDDACRPSYLECRLNEADAELPTYRLASVAPGWNVAESA